MVCIFTVERRGEERRRHLTVLVSPTGPPVGLTNTIKNFSLWYRFNNFEQNIFLDRQSVS